MNTMYEELFIDYKYSCKSCQKSAGMIALEKDKVFEKNQLILQEKCGECQVIYQLHFSDLEKV